MLALLLAAAAQAAAGRAPLEFPSDVRLIRLDVSVVDGGGRATAGLLAGDFEIFEDGRPVPVTYFEAVEGQAPAALDATVEAAVDAAGPIGRRLVILVDAARMSLGEMRRAREGVERFLRSGASDGDWVRLVNLSTGSAWEGRIPDDRFRLSLAARAIERGSLAVGFGGRDVIEERVERRSEGGTTSAVTRGQFLSVFAETSGLLGTLESLMLGLGGVAGRKAVVLVSPGFPQINDFEADLERISSQAREASTTFYFVDVAGLDGLLPDPGGRLQSAFDLAWSRTGGAQDLAEATGGVAFRFSNALAPALGRIGDEMRTYYVVGYAPSRPNDGRFHSVKVKVRVGGLSARTKKGYIADGRAR